MAAYTPTIGSKVHTADGDKLGEVKEIRGSHFKVNASMQPDYWLDTTCIAGVDGGHVRLAFAKDRLDEYKRTDLMN